MRAMLIVVVLCLGGTARADGLYFTWGYGGSDVKNELATYMSNTVNLRAALGLRQGAWAVEARMVGHLGLESGHRFEGDRQTDAILHSLVTFGVDVKYIQPLVPHLEAYVRGGLSYGMIDGDVAGRHMAGRGIGGGAGVQLEGKVRALGFLAWPFFFLPYGPKITAAVYLDAGYDFLRLHPDGELHATPAIDAELTTISVGFAVGTDF